MTDKVDGLVMFSGGLDSVVTAHLLKSQGLSLLALHYVLPFHAGLGDQHAGIRGYADQLGISLRIEEEGEDFMAMVRSPRFGYGKNANPCLDCRIHRLVKARSIMEELGASFIATGEVIGQRPKSQRLECLYLIERRTGLYGRLLRPLSALLLPPTVAEQEGRVDRSKLMACYGRGRKPQLEYARTHGLAHSPPAGGCLLTNEGPSRRYHVLAEKYPDFTYEDFRLVAYGRHFALNDQCRLVIARNDAENAIFEKIVAADDLQLEPADITGPLGVLRGHASEANVMQAASFIARYSRARSDALVRIRIFSNSGEAYFRTVKPADPAACDACHF